MPLSSIVLVVLRLFAIQWLFQAISLFFSAVSLHAMYHENPIAFWNFFTPVALLIIAIIVWFFSPTLSRLLTRGHDLPVNVSGLSLEDLACFAFIFLGLYFILISIAPSLNWLHYFYSLASIGGQYAERQKSFYELSGPLINLAAGFAILFRAKKWSKKLLERE